MKRLSIVCSLLIAAAALAQDHPNEARGFAPSKLYDFHDIDTINAFNGNLIVRVPVGPVYRANALVKYQFTLVYNSHAWHYDENADGTFTVLPKKTNAGLGWSLSLGRLIMNDDTGSDTNSPYPIYEAADGSQHAFYAELHCASGGDTKCLTFPTGNGYTGYTRDSTYLRIRDTSTYAADGTLLAGERQVDFPDGTTQVFWLLLPATNAQTWQRSTAANAVWRLVQLKSVLANTVSITYSGDATYQEIWTVSDSDRTSTAYFKPTGLSIQPLILDHIDLPATNSRTATYTFANSGQTVLPTPGPASPPVQGFGGVPVFLLTSVTLPPDDSGSQAVYSMIDGQIPAYWEYGGDMSLDQCPGTASQGCYWSGALRKLTLPTGGAISWTYSTISFDPPGGIAKSPAVIRPIAVTTRTTYPSGSTAAEGVWQYGRKFALVGPCDAGGGVFQSFKRQLTSWVMRPQTSGDPQYATVSYFSIFDGDSDLCVSDPNVGNPEGWQTSEYGLPFTRYANGTVNPDYGTVSRYLSSELLKDFSPPTTWNGRGSISGATPTPTVVSSNYVTYELDEETQNCCDNDHNARVSSTATTYPLDTGCGGVCFKASNFFNIDGFGHYRQTSATSNFPGDDSKRTKWTDYATTLDANSDWVLGTWDKHCVVRDGSPRGPIDVNAIPNPCTSFSLVTHALFASDTGLLSGQRTLNVGGSNSDALHGSDLLTTYTYDQRGYRLSEKYSGGDQDSLSTLSSAEFSPPTTPAYYEIDYASTYPGGQLTARSGTYATAGLSILNETYDPRTGLVLTSTDASGVTTTYTYDRRGRVRTAATPGNADINYSYTDGAATVTVKRLSGPTVLAQQEYDYDGFGRLNYERKLMPDNTWSVRQTLYTPTGLNRQVSEFEAAPTHFTVFSGFDAFDHATTIQAPDGHVTSVNYSFNSTNPSLPGTDPMKPGVRQRSETKLVATASGGSETSQTRMETYDSLGRLQQVTEPAGSSQTTTYAYDVGGHLQTVTQTDGTSTQTRTFNYDPRGFLTSETHPESGTTNYSGWDARGHVGTKSLSAGFTDCTPGTFRCFDLQYTYDKAERLTKVASRDPGNTSNFRSLKEFSYATANAGSNLKQGKLEIATRHNYQPGANGPNLSDVVVAETYGYNDLAGRLTDQQTDIGVGTSINKTLKQSYTYNLLGLISQITYPTCYTNPGQAGCAWGTWGNIQPSYTNGALTRVSTPDVTPQDFASSISYWSNGMVNTVSHSNGVADTYEIHDTVGATNGMARPKSISFTGWTACTPPAISLQPTITSAAPYYYGNSQTLSVSASGVTTYQWYQGSPPDTSTPVGTNSAQFTTSALTQTTTFWAQVRNACGQINSNPVTVAVTLRAPTGLVAARNVGTNTITLTWQGSSGATSYSVWRRSGASFAFAGTSASTTFTDSVWANAAFFYQVTASGASGVNPSGPGNNDEASTLGFQSVTAGGTVSFSQFDELLTSGVNAIRAAWGASSWTWSDVLNQATNSCGYGTVSQVPAVGQLVYAAHLMRLRCAMDNALALGGVARTWSYTDPDVTNLFIKAVHMTDLQGRTGNGQ